MNLLPTEREKELFYKAIQIYNRTQPVAEHSLRGEKVVDRTLPKGVAQLPKGTYDVIVHKEENSYGRVKYRNEQKNRLYIYTRFNRLLDKYLLNFDSSEVIIPRSVLRWCSTGDSHDLIYRTLKRNKAGYYEYVNYIHSLLNESEIPYKVIKARLAVTRICLEFKRILSKFSRDYSIQDRRFFNLRNVLHEILLYLNIGDTRTPLSIYKNKYRLRSCSIQIKKYFSPKEVKIDSSTKI
jgi:hypothetical protein